MSSSSSSSDDSRSDQGGVPLCPPPPRRKPSAVVAPAATSTSKSSSHKNTQAEAKNYESATPAGKTQHEASASPFHHQTPAQLFNPAHPKMQTPSYSLTSESSSGYYPAGIYGGYLQSPGAPLVPHRLPSSSTSYTDARLDTITTGLANVDLKLHECHKEASRSVRNVQERIYKINQAVYQQAGLPSQFAHGIDGALKELGQDVVRLGSLVDEIRSNTGKKDTDFQKVQAAAGMQAVEIERLRSELETVRLRLGASEKNNEEVQSTYQGVILSMEQKNRAKLEQLQEQLQHCKEQLEGKRNLFFTTAQDAESKAKMISVISGSNFLEKAKVIQHIIDADPQDKYKILDILTHSNGLLAPSRSVSYQPSLMAVQSDSSNSGYEAAWSRPPSRMTPPTPLMPGTGRRTPSSFHGNSLVRPGSVHPGNARLSQPRSRPSTSHGHRGPRQESGALTLYRFDDEPHMADRSTQEFGSPQPTRARQAVVAQAQVEWDTQIATWKLEFGKVFGMVHGWASQYASQVKKFQAAALPNEAPRLWEYMTDMLYPGQPEAGASHAAFLIEDPQCRQYFVERTLLQYIVTNIFSVEAWMDHDQESDRELKDLQARLDSTEVFKSYIRQGIVDNIGRVIGNIMANADFGEYRQRRITFHSQRLKTIVGPLVDETASRQDAAFDLHNVANAALQVSAMMFQSRLNFEFQWTTTCAKFSADQHEALGMEAGVDPVMLQQKQYRIKLVVTPTILFRDDRGVSINPKRVARSTVFVMN